MLFSDTETEVRRAASQCFQGFEGNDLSEYETLIKEYIQSLAFEPEYNPLFEALEWTSAYMPDIVLMACERLFDLAGDKVGNISTAIAGSSATIAKLIVRVYSRTLDADIRSRCLDIVDKMSILRAHGLEVITEEFDR